MNQIPDIILIDFCEWLKQQIEAKLTVGSISYIFKEDYSSLLEHCAKLYLDTTRNNKGNNNLSSDITSNITAEILVSNLIELFSDGPSQKHNIDNNNNIKSTSMYWGYMTHIKSDKCIEVDFLEWLIDNNQGPIDFSQLSLRAFKHLANSFQNDCNKSNSDIQKLVKTFKETNRYVLADKLVSLLSNKSLKKAQDLGYIWGRYHSSQVKFKCLIIPLKKHIDSYIDFIENRWEDLHHLTENYLDIYYSKSDYCHSGFQTLKQLHYLSADLKKHAPAIIIWQDRIVNAKSICISDAFLHKTVS